jgi:hypothetical protein
VVRVGADARRQLLRGVADDLRALKQAIGRSGG